MEKEKLPCDKHEAEIKTLFKQDEAINRRIDNIETKMTEVGSLKDFIHNLDKNMAVQTEMMKHIVEHNTKQDERMDKQDKRMDDQDKKTEEQHKVMVQISTNLTELNEGYKRLGQEIKEIKDVQDINESKHNIDLRDIEKKKFTDVLIKYGLPITGGLVVLWEILKIIKG